MYLLLVPSLDALAGWEAAILASIAGATGSDEERDRQIARSGLYDEYANVVAAYAEHFSRPATGDEALARAAFLVWHGALEPRHRTGIGELPAPVARHVAWALDYRAYRGTLARALDGELPRMLAWYHALLPDLLPLVGATRTAQEVERLPPDAWRATPPDARTLPMRGAMGRYWASLLADGVRLPPPRERARW